MNDWPKPQWPRWITPDEKCLDCNTLLTPPYRATYTQQHTWCYEIMWDDIGWLTGTGRYAQ